MCLQCTPGFPKIYQTWYILDDLMGHLEWATQGNFWYTGSVHFEFSRWGNWNHIDWENFECTHSVLSGNIVIKLSISLRCIYDVLSQGTGICPQLVGRGRALKLRVIRCWDRWDLSPSSSPSVIEATDAVNDLERRSGAVRGTYKLPTGE